MKQKLLKSSSRKSIDLLYVFITCLCCLFIGKNDVFAQNPSQGTIQIGSGDAVITGAMALPVANFSYNYSQQIVKAEEYATAFGAPGTITKIRYFVTNAGTVANWSDWTIYLGNTNKTSFTSNTDWVSVNDMQLVFSGTITATTNSWFEITLDTPFVYTGSNIVIAVDENSANYTGNPTFLSYTSSDNTGISYRSDQVANNPNPASPPSASFRTGSVPQIQFFGDIIECAPPLNSLFTNITSNQAVVDFGETVGDGISYAITTTNTPPAIDTLIPITPGTTGLTLSNLTSNTTYYLWFKGVCNGQVNNLWKKYTFITTCSSFSLPHFENFDSYNHANNVIPTCWYRPIIYSGYPKIVNAQSVSAPNSLRFQSQVGSPTYAITAPIDHNINEVRVSFKMKREGVNSGSMSVGVMSDPNDLSSFVEITTITPTDNDYHDYTVNLISSTITGNNRFIAFKHTSLAQNFFYWIDDVLIEQIPGCLVPDEVQVLNVSKNTATLTWEHPEILPNNGYEYEIRTSGDVGSGAAGLVATGTVSSTNNSVNLSSLLPGTTYFVYVRSICSTSNLSEWSEVEEFTTFCDFPDLVDVVIPEICGIGTSTIVATVVEGGQVEWFDSINSNFRIFNGNSFVTPELNQTTPFYLTTSVAADNTDIYIGEGASTSATYSNPFYSLWSNNHTQHLITAEELLASGLLPGDITELGLNVTAAGTLPMLNFTLKIGTSDVEELQNFVPNDDFVVVNTNASFMPVAGVNMIVFDQPYTWDGVSNIILEFCHFNPTSSASMNRTVKSDATSYVSTVKANITVANDLATACENTTTGKSTYSVRPQFIFKGTGMCRSPKQLVNVVVDEAEDIVLSTNSITDICQGNNTPLVTITEGAEHYDQYIWTPSEGVFGDAENGFYFNVHENTVFTLKAINSQTNCRVDKIITVEINSMYYTPLPNQIVTCGNEIIQLDVTGELGINAATTGEILGHYSFDTLQDSGWTHNNLTGTTTVESMNTLASEGNGYLRFSHEHTSTGNITFDGSFNAENSNGIIVDFKHMAILEGNSADFGVVEYSLDNGTTWVVMNPSQYVGAAQGLQAAGYKRFGRQSYTEWSSYTSSTVPSVVSWKNERFVLLNTDAIDLSNVKFRFSLKADGSVKYYGWLLDDVRISTVGSHDFEWNSDLTLYTDAEATQVYNGESISKVYVRPTIPVRTPVSVTVSYGACQSTDEIEIYFPELVVPDFSNEHYCQPVSVTEMTFDRTADHTYTWYNSQFSQTPIDTIPFSGTYYVQISIEGCTSQRIAVPVIIVGNVSVTVASVQKFCDFATVADLVATPSSSEAQINWYASLDSTVALDTTTQLQDNTTYYVSQNLYGCVTERKPVLVRIFDTLDSLDVTEINVCYNSTVGSISIEGAFSLTWYASFNSNTPLHPNQILTSGVYFISSTNDICQSEKVAITVNVIEYLPTISTTLINICGAGVVSDLNGYLTNVVPGAELRWYNSSTSNSPLSSTEALTTGTYYVEQALASCSSTRRAVAVRVISKVAPVINSQIVCEGTKVRDIVLPGASSVTYKWYSTPTSLVALGDEHVFTTGMYYVKRNQFGCESSAAQVFVDVKPLPNSPIGSLIQELEEGSVISDIVMNSNDVVWYISETDALYGINPLDPNMPIVNGTTYYGVLINEFGCPSIPTAVTVNLFLGLNDLDISKLNVYPNPTDSQITIKYKEQIDAIEIYSLLGQKMIEHKTYTDEVQVDLSQLASGTYMLKIVVGNNTQLIKIVKK